MTIAKHSTPPTKVTTVGAGMGSSALPYYIIDTVKYENHPNPSDKDDMVIDGSVTPANFEFKPGTGSWSSLSGIWVINKLIVVLGALNDPDHNEFGGTGVLSNGLELSYQQDGSSYTVRTIQKNIELTALFLDFHTVGATDSKWLKDTGGRYFVGSVELHPPIQIDASKGDYLRVKVQDNLTANDLAFLNIGFRAWKDVT